MRDVGIGTCTSPYHYGQKNPEILNDKEEWRSRTTLLVRLLSFNTKQNTHTKKQQKALFFFCHLEESNLNKPQNPILSKPTMCQMDLQNALHHMLKKKKGCPFLPKGRREKIPWSLFWVFFFVGSPLLEGRDLASMNDN